MNNYQQQRQQILQLFQQVQALVTQSKRKDITKTLQESAERFSQGKLTVIVAGEFKQGKSSLINALINEQDLFPVDVDITTNLISTITYGKEEKVTVVLGETGNSKTKNITRAEIPDYVTEQKNHRNQKKAQMLVIESPNPQLKEGLVLVDTPGVGGLNAEHTAVSYAFIPNADVVIFVSDTEKPYTVKELEFIEMINRQCQNFIFVITKKDRSNYQEIVNNNLEKLTQRFNWNETDIKMIPVSSHNKLSYLKTQDEEDLEDSNFIALETEVWETLTRQRGSILSLRALVDIEKALSQVKTPIQVEWEACQQTPDKLLEIQDEFKLTQNKLKNLLVNNAEWRTQLLEGLQDIRVTIAENFQDKFLNINRQLPTYTENSNLRENPKQIVSLLETDIDSLMTDLGQELSYLAGNLHSQIELSTGLDMDSSVINSSSNLETNHNILEEVKFKQQTKTNKLLQISRNVTYNMSTAATIGGLAGGTIGYLFGGVGSYPGYYIGAAIGGGLASIAGLVTGVQEGIEKIEKEQERNQETIVNSIKPFLNDSQRSCRNTLDKALRELEKSMRNELTTQIQQEKETCDRTLRSLKEAQQLTEAETKRKISELKPILQRINHLEQQIAKLTETTLAQKEVSNQSNIYKPSDREKQTEVKTVTPVGVTTSEVEDNEDWADG